MTPHLLAAVFDVALVLSGVAIGVYMAAETRYDAARAKRRARSTEWSDSDE